MPAMQVQEARPHRLEHHSCLVVVGPGVRNCSAALGPVHAAAVAVEEDHSYFEGRGSHCLAVEDAAPGWALGHHRD